MTELVFILTDFPTAAISESTRSERAVVRKRGAAHTSMQPPRLATLETLLARARSAAPVDDWRAWLAAHVGASGPTAAAAAVVAAASGLLPAAAHAGGEGHWLATPVHLFAGLDRVQLHPAGLLQLTGAEQQLLVTQFASVFGDSPWRLCALGQRELLLTGPSLWASGIDPARFTGDDPSAGLPRGPDAAALKRLGAEFELWLHEHPLNEERSRRGELPVTTLWLWGGQISPAGTPAGQPVHSAEARPTGTSVPGSRPPLARLFGNDTYAEALWRLHGARIEPLPASVSAAAAALAGPTDCVVLFPMKHEGGLNAAFEQFEQRWLAAASDALRRRRIQALRLIVGTHSYRLRGLDLLKLWRKRTPWWEVLT